MKGKIVIASGKRKTAVARAIVKPGKGRVWINSIPIEFVTPELARAKMLEPLLLAGRKIRSMLDIKVKVEGGGFMGQAEAVRMAIARGILEFFKCEGSGPDCEKMNELYMALKQIFEEHDRTMIAGDPRRTEPEKYMRYSARRRWQKSYR